jgi:hypothetical protein
MCAEAAVGASATALSEAAATTARVNLRNMVVLLLNVRLGADRWIGPIVHQSQPRKIKFEKLRFGS